MSVFGWHIEWPVILWLCAAISLIVAAVVVDRRKHYDAGTWLAFAAILCAALAFLSAMDLGS